MTFRIYLEALEKPITIAEVSRWWSKLSVGGERRVEWVLWIPKGEIGPEVVDEDRNPNGGYIIKLGPEHGDHIVERYDGVSGEYVADPMGPLNRLNLKHWTQLPI